MNYKKLNIPLIKQKKNSVECGFASLLMIFDFYGVKKSFTELRKDLEIFKIGTYAPQLGAYLCKNGFEVELVTQHPGLFTLYHRKYSQEKILTHFKKLLKSSKSDNDKIVLKYFIEFMECGGKIKVAVPNADYIKTSLKTGYPLISLLTSNFLSSKEVGFNFHFNVITGISDKYIFTNDPGTVFGGKKKHLIEDFLFGMHASVIKDLDNGSLLKIIKVKI